MILFYITFSVPNKKSVYKAVVCLYCAETWEDKGS